MNREAQYDAQCAECGGKITAGEQMTYLPPSGDRPAFTAHAQCPEPKKVAPRGVNHGQREDPEQVAFVMRECDGCNKEWAVPRTSLASKRPGFTCHHCIEREQNPALRAEA